MKCSLVLVILAAAPAFAQSGVTGNWTGQYNFSVQISSCSNKTFTAGGAVSATFLQSGTSVSGRIDLKNFLALTSCNSTFAEATDVAVGSITGNTIELAGPNSPASTRFTGTTDGSTISLQWSDDNGGTGTITLSRVPGDAPATDAPGAWSGTYSFTDQCSNGVKISYTGAMTMTGTQAGSPYGGVVTLQSVPVYDQNCSKLGTLDMAMIAAGSVFGSTLSGGVWDASGSFEFPVAATIDGSSMAGTVSGANGTDTTGTFTLTRNNADVPASDITGSYEGSYDEVDNERATCLNIATLSFSGDASLSVVQAGNNVSGWLTFHDEQDVASDGFGNCVVVGIGDEVLPFNGTLTGSTLMIQTIFGQSSIDINTTFGNDAATGTLASNSAFAQFSVSKPAAPAPGPRRRAARP